MIDLTVLIVEDSEKDAALLLRKLKEAGYNPVYEMVDNRETMISALEQRKWDIILSDWVMPQFSGLSALEVLRASGNEIPFIVVSGEIEENVIFEAMTAGAADYLMKANLKCLGVVIAKGLTDVENRRQLRHAEKKLSVAEAELNDLLHRLIKIQEDEKRSLSRELHDEIGQRLAYLRLLVDRAGQHSSPEAQTILNESKDIISRLVDQVRNLSLNLKPPVLEEDSLAQAVKYLAERQAKESDLKLTLSFIDIPVDLSWDISLTAYRIIQEALTNITKHAAASQITVEIKADDNQLNVNIADNGKGFVAGDSDSGFGLSVMRERAAIFKGSLSIESRPGAGTIIKASIPLVRAGKYPTDRRQGS